MSIFSSTRPIIRMASYKVIEKQQESVASRVWRSLVSARDCTSESEYQRKVDGWMAYVQRRFEGIAWSFVVKKKNKLHLKIECASKRVASGIAAWLQRGFVQGKTLYFNFAV